MQKERVFLLEHDKMTNMEDHETEGEIKCATEVKQTILDYERKNEKIDIK